MTIRFAAFAGLLALACVAESAPPISLEFDWLGFADPAGILNVENGITDGESAEFDRYGSLLVTASKADARHPSDQHGKTAHLRMWNAATGELIWDQPRHPGQVGQPSNGEDEIEVALFSPDGRYIAAGGEDDKVEIWRVRNDDQGADEWLPQPILVRTFSTGDGDPETDDAAIDSMAYTNDGRLLLLGTEQGGKVEIFRVQGDPATWQFMSKAKHGGRLGFAVNSLDTTSDDRYVGTVGTDTNGVFWRLDGAENSDGLITDVEMVQIAYLPSQNGKAIDGSGREARFEPNGDRHFIFTLEHTGNIQVYDVDELKAWDGPNTSGPEPIQVISNGTDIKDGNEIEPAAYTHDGRFLIVDGDTRVNGSTEGIFPGFYRIYETAEIQRDAPEPDPVYLQKALTTEYFDFRPDDTRLAVGQGDGTVRVWTVHSSGAETIAAEAFNEIATSSRVAQSTPFRGHRGRHYLAIPVSEPEAFVFAIKDTWDLSGYTLRQLQFAAVAAPGVFESGDFLRVMADMDGDETFETVIAEFLPDADGDLALNGNGAKLNNLFLEDDGVTELYYFADYFVDLEALLPADFAGKIRFRVEAKTDAANEEIGFDSLRVTGISQR